jgi:hypothetical protein
VRSSFAVRGSDEGRKAATTLAPSRPCAIGRGTPQPTISLCLTVFLATKKHKKLKIFSAYFWAFCASLWLKIDQLRVGGAEVVEDNGSGCD